MTVPAAILKITTEAAWQRTIVEAAKWMGYRVYHTQISIHSVKGFPDLVLVGRGQVVFAEVKTATGKVSPEQHAWIAAITANGGLAYIWRPADWLDVERVLRAGVVEPVQTRLAEV